VNFERLTRGHLVAAVSALALLLVMAMDWYGSVEADEARRIGNTAQTSGAQAGEPGRAVKADADRIVARDEKNAWQADGTIDRALLALLLLSVLLPLAAAGFRAQGRRFTPPLTPSSLAALTASLAALLVAYRIVQEPGDDAFTTVKIGTILGLLLLAGVGMGAVAAFQKETEWVDMRRAAAAEPPAS
jgi:hypothetical protein